MRWVFRLLVLLPIALVLLSFSVANRHFVKLSLDPLPLNDIEGPYLELPLFLLLFAAGALGVLAGGMIVWFRQGRYRRQLRDARGEAAEARGQMNDIRDRLALLESASALPAPRRDAA